jgi:hypothetical protein
VGDALHKPLRLGLARRDKLGRLEAVPIDQALVALDRRWDGVFQFT